MEYLYILQQALVWIITIFWIYQMAISICSLIKLKDKPFIINKNHKLFPIISILNFFPFLLLQNSVNTGIETLFIFDGHIINKITKWTSITKFSMSPQVLRFKI